MNGSCMRTLIQRRTLMVVFVLGVFALAWWIVRDEPREAGLHGKLMERTGTPREGSKDENLPPRDNEEPRIDTAEEEEAFYFPFLGKVKSEMKVREVAIHADDGSTLTIPFRVYSDERGQFRRAEFAQEGTGELEWSVTHIKEAMEASREKVLGLPKEPAPVSWLEVVSKVAQEVPMKDVKRINVTYVNYQFRDEPPAPLFIVNVFGVDAMPPPAYTMKRDPKWERTQFVFDANGTLFLMDNCL